METSTHYPRTWLFIIHWTARITALCFLIVALAYLVGSYMDPAPRPGPRNARDYFFLSLMGLTLAGYLVGLWLEGLGGIMGLAASITFLTCQSIVMTIDFPLFLAFLFSILPSTLYLISWFFNRKTPKKQLKKSGVTSI